MNEGALILFENEFYAGTWASLFLILIARGPGAVSFDYLIGRC